MKIMIDPGHGGNDPGAVAHGLEEADINLQVALFLENCFLGKAKKVWMTRRDDRSVDLGTRTNMEHALRPDLTISLHCNAATSVNAHGFEVWTSLGKTASDRAAFHVINSIQNTFPQRKLRYDLTKEEESWDLDREKNLWMCRKTAGPAILVEMGFITNEEEAAWLAIPQNQLNIANSIVMGVLAWRGES